MAADLVAAWRTDGLPTDVKSSAGLRRQAEAIVGRAGGRADHVGWTMVTIVSEYWRPRLATAANGRRLLLLPDCVGLDHGSSDAGDGSIPRTCGPACGIATIWAAARDSGWVVGSNRGAVASIGGLLTGQYDGILGVARLGDLEKAFAMLPAFGLPVAAVPFDLESWPVRAAAGACGCSGGSHAGTIDVDWVLGLLGVAGGQAAPVGDYLPLLREAAEMFTAPGLRGLAERLGAEPCFGLDPSRSFEALPPLVAAEALAADFLCRGGKFLRPFITLAAFDAVRADRTEVDRTEVGGAESGGAKSAGTACRDAVRAAAVAIEVFHKASLVHDDIEDGDHVRYGSPTLHQAWGVPTAINAGDYLLGAGYRIIAGLPEVEAAATRDCLAILADAHVRLARGQGAELWWRDASDKRLSSDESLEIYGLKTSPAFEAAIALGVRLAGVEPAALGSLGRYALHVGTGFQVLNDLKDWEGDVENDRRAAGDLLGGRPTLMWALALERLSPGDQERLREAAEEAGRPDADEATVASRVADVRRLYRQAEVFSRAIAIVSDQRRQAIAALASCRRERLREVLEFLLDLAVPEPAVEIPSGVGDAEH